MIRSVGRLDALLAYLMLLMEHTEKTCYFRTTHPSDGNMYHKSANNPIPVWDRQKIPPSKDQSGWRSKIPILPLKGNQKNSLEIGRVGAQKKRVLQGRKAP